MAIEVTIAEIRYKPKKYAYRVLDGMGRQRRRQSRQLPQSREDFLRLLSIGQLLWGF